MQHLKTDQKITQEWERLYHEVNNLLRELGEKGQITPQDKVVDNVLDALFKIDGGIHRKIII